MNSIMITNVTKKNLKIISKSIFNVCKHVHNITLCNSMLKLSLLDLTDCVKDILSNKTRYCDEKEIAHHNYLTNIGPYDM